MSLALELYAHDIFQPKSVLNVIRQASHVVERLAERHVETSQCFAQNVVRDSGNADFDCFGGHGFPFVGVADTYSVQH